METDFFVYSCRKIEKDKEEGHFEAAHNREMALRCFVNFLGKEELSLNELTPELMVKFEEWLNTKGRKQSTTRLYLYQISSVYNIAVKEGIVPKLKLLKGVRVALPAKKERELLSVDELRRMRYADLSDSIPQTFARDMFFFCIYGRGISFTDLANIKKTDIKGFTLTYISQIPGLPRITIQWDAAMQEIADRYPSDSEFLFPFIKSTDMQMADCEVKRVRQNVMRAFKRIATRCNLSVVPSMGMVKDIYQRAIDGVSVSKII